MTTQTTLPTAPARRMYANLAEVAPRPLRAAFTTVRDMIDMALLSPEVLTDVVLGRRPLAQAMADLGEIMADALADSDDPDSAADMAKIITDCKAAALALA